MLFVLGVLSLAFTAPAFANKDILYPSGASATVNGASAATSNAFSVGSAGSTTLDNAVYAGNAVSVTTTWSIYDRSAIGGGQDTTYPTSAVTFTASTTVKPSGAANVSVNAISNCILESIHSVLSYCA